MLLVHYINWGNVGIYSPYKAVASKDLFTHKVNVFYYFGLMYVRVRKKTQIFNFTNFTELQSIDNISHQVLLGNITCIISLTICYWMKWNEMKTNCFKRSLQHYVFIRKFLIILKLEWWWWCVKCRNLPEGTSSTIYFSS